MRIGILGGSFDPIHVGHINIANAAKRQFNLDSVWIMPAKIPPHKRNGLHTEDIHRLQMIDLALLSEENLEINLLEFERNDISYTSDTLRLITEHFTNDEFFYIMGQDSLKDFPTWHEPDKIASMVTVLVAVRNGNEREFQALVDERNNQYGDVFRIITIPYDEVSSSEIRDLLKHGDSVEGLLPPKVEQYIHHCGIYDTNSDVITTETMKQYRDITDRLQETLSEHRLMHSKGVAFTAVNIICSMYDNGYISEKERFCLANKVLLAGILHDCAKYIPDSEIIEFCRDHQIDIKDDEKEFPQILHAPAGRYLAEAEYGITDDEILSAILYHVNGKPDMNITEMAVFLSDYFEPTRTQGCTPSLSVLRRSALSNPYETVILVAGATIHFLNTVGYRYYPILKETLEHYEKVYGITYADRYSEK